MRARWPSVLAWGLAVAEFAVVTPLVLASGGNDLGAIASLVFILVFAVTGAMVTTKVPGNPVGWLMCWAPLSFAIGGVCVTVAEWAARGDHHGPLITVSAVVSTFVWIAGLGPAGTFLLLLFPDGRLPSRRWRIVAWLSAVTLAAAVVGTATVPGVIEDTQVTNPLGLDAAPGLSAALRAFGYLGLLLCVLASCASLFVRYRHATTSQRQQLKWLAWSVPVVLAFIAASIAVGSIWPGSKGEDLSNALSALGVAAVPMAIGVAVLRYRLYDIDVVIKRTLVYSLLTAALVATYLVLVLVLQVLLTPVSGRSDLAVAASTLAVAALFRPLRARIQGTVDRRFYRSRYDATRTLATFSGHLRDELDLEQLGSDLRTVVRDTMQPQHVSIWLKER